MQPLSKDIKTYFFQTIIEEIPLLEFEEWLYKNNELETLLRSDDYLELISLDFNKKGAKYELNHLLTGLIDPAEFETFKMLNLLEKTSKKTKELPFLLMQFYDLYCKGYSFVEVLGLTYGHAVEVPLVKNSSANSWNELTAAQQAKLLSDFSPGLEAEIERVTQWLTSKQIVLTGEQDLYGHFVYIDYGQEDKVPKNVVSEKQMKKWWRLW
ncbi:hypothetical protein [Pedobacter immunditicola]|uniref:hypothetical protein n=1 Tax=Pedobacter immunditicola TaxID=3133440 RepID=UPI0030A12372